MGFFSSTSTSYVGIDIGTSGIKIVELKKERSRPKLVSYGFSENISNNNIDWKNDVKYIAKIINEICGRSGIKSRNVVSALPTFSVFSSIINLPDIPKKDFDSAVHWEAKKVIPLPLEEMSIDWRELKNNSDEKGNRILLIGAPRSLVNKQMEIFKEAKMNLLFLETETFSLVRSIVGNDESSIALVEIGATTSDVSIVDNGIPVFSRSIDTGGETITRAIQNNLNIGLERAEQFKYDLGINSMDSSSDVIPQTIKDTISPVVNEIRYAIELFEKGDKKVEKIILSGGSSLLSGLVDYLSSELDINVIIGNPWARVLCPEEIKPLLNEIGAKMAVSIGLAMRGFDK
ncbi:type IV pilus assembly protein PilM [Candidatus Parcubacteria bacterium]|nr:type IV pilus assembly protein PilM [Candidatus Parcubacteria bacterium]